MSFLAFRITNLTCDACVKVCTFLIKQIPEVTKVTIDPKTGIASVESSQPIKFEIIRDRLESKKFKAKEAAV